MITYPITTNLLFSIVQSTVYKVLPKKGCITDRIQNFLSLGGCMFLGAIGDTALGVMGGCGAILTLGLHKETVRFSYRHLQTSQALMAGPCGALLGVFNRQVRNDYPSQHNSCGIFTAPTVGYLTDSIAECVESPNWAHRHITSRLMHLVALVASVVTGVADGVIGMIAWGAACCTLGMVSSLNRMALSNLKASGACIGNIMISVLGFVNPQAVEEGRRRSQY